jgi:protocatechuate 3,4-dioxygenase beta subunit
MHTTNRRRFCAGSIAAAAISHTSVGEIFRGQFDGHLTCIRTPEGVDGPYYVESSMMRRAIAEDRPGRRLRLRITVANAMRPGDSCAPLRGALVDVWQADADGLYSNVAAEEQDEDTSGKTFLRGHQITDDSGVVEFETVVPGWYLGRMPVPIGNVPRTPHVHVKVFQDHKIVTTQLYFPDRLLDDLYARANPYTMHRRIGGVARVRNAEDAVYIDDQSRPMDVVESKGVLHASAMIGVVTLGARGLKPLFR